MWIKNNHLHGLGCGRRLALGAAITLLLCAIGIAQRRSAPGTESDVFLSRAEQDAEQKVSFSADTIIGVLRREPGLLLQVKRALVRKAYEQGRILEQEDLTDEALFRLLRTDSNVRILATHEIEDRLYIRAKPTLEEREREQLLEAQRGLSRTANKELEPAADTTNQTAKKPAKSQEEAYWSRREQGLQDTSPGSIRKNDRQLEAAPPDSADQPRLLNRARTGAPGENPYESMDGLNERMTRIQPDDLPTLLNTAASRSPQPYQGPDWGTNPRESRTTTPPGGMSANPSAGNLRDQMPDRESETTLATRIPLRPSTTTQFPRVVPDRPAIRHRPNPYADVPSLYDMYAQTSKRNPMLERFAADVFRNGTGNLDDLPMDLPVGPDYMLGPGDGLSINLWGSVDQRLQRIVDREGRVALPEVGTVLVAGRSLGETQHMVQAALRTQFHGMEADISLSRLRTVRVYVVGDVLRPGAYDISSLSTPLNALYTAGGPTDRGSLRTLRHYRGKQLVQVIDTYDLLLHGMQGDLQHLQAGDTILVPPIGPQVTVDGMVRRPAIYELNTEKDLAETLELAGGVMSSGTLRHIEVERVEAHEKRTMLRLDLPESNDAVSVDKALEAFKIQDGDVIRIAPILPYSEKTVFLDGHVFHPGKFAYREGMKVSDLIKSYNDLLPEPSERHAEIIRLNAPDYTPIVLAFNLGDALSGKGESLLLKPFDTVRVFGRYDFEDPPVITVNGEVRDPGDRLTNGVTRLRDAIYLAGGVTPDAQTDDVQVFRRTSDGKLKVLSVNLEKALAGNEADNVLLEAKDRVFVHRSQAKADPPTVIVQGEVERPGKYPLGEDMTASQLVRLSGGLKRSAYTEDADLSRYLSKDGQGKGEHETVAIAKAIAGVDNADVTLHDGDVLTIRQIAGWADLGSVITVKGEVQHPGGYGIREGERLSSILLRAGGLRGSAYPYGAILEREQVRQIEEHNHADLLQRVQAEGDSLRTAPDGDQDQKLAKQAALLQWQTTMERLQNTPPPGRLVVHLSRDINKWANTSADVEVRAGDVLTIPKKPNFVMVDGSVYNPTAVTFKPGKSAAWYLRQAGGPTAAANKKAVFVIRADGSVAGGSGGLFNGDALRAEMRPGDMVVVPEKAFGASTKWKNTLQASQLVYAVGIAVQVARSF